MPRDEAVAEVRQHLAAAPSRVFAAFADPVLVSRWLTPSPEVAVHQAQRAALDAIGMSTDDRAKVMGGNFERLFPHA